MWVDTELQRQLQAYIDEIAGDSDWTVCLYQNNHTPAAGDDISDYTEATFTGYAQDDFAPSTFGAVSVVSHVAQSVSSFTAEFTQTSGSNQTIYGYYLLDDGGNFIGAEMFASPVTMSPGGTLEVTPTLKHAIYPP